MASFRICREELVESPSACRDCCNDGKAYVPCLNVEAGQGGGEGTEVVLLRIGMVLLSDLRGQ